MKRFSLLPALSLLGILNICLGLIGVLAFGSVLVAMAALLMGLLEHYPASLLTVAVYELAYDPMGWCVLVLALLSGLLLLIAGAGYLRGSRSRGRFVGNVYVVVSVLEGVVVLVIANEVMEILENAVFRVFFFALPLINGVLINSVLKQDFTED